MAYIENASADLGCVSIKVIEAGTNVVNLITWILRTEKVLFIDVENQKLLMI
jgi:Ni,Fe-hydrogenase maturation factor